jgi:purine-nucleoside phosphorylase
VHEVITARHCDLKVFGFSLITNKCETDYDAGDDADHDDIVNIGARGQTRITRFVTRMVEEINLIINTQ